MEFNVTDKNIKFYFAKWISDEEGFCQVTIAQGAYEIESLKKEIKRIVIDEGHFPEGDYPFTIKPNNSNLGSIIEISTQGPIISSLPDDSIRDLLGFNACTIYGEYNSSPNLVAILSVDNFFRMWCRSRNDIPGKTIWNN